MVQSRMRILWSGGRASTVCLDIVDDGWQDWSGAVSGNNLGKEVGSAVEQWQDLAGSAVCTVRSLGSRPEAFLL